MSNLEDHEAEQAAITAACEHIEAHKLTYTVIVTRDVTESTVIQLTAPTEQQACDMALELSGREGTEWRRDDVSRPASENYVTYVSVAEPAPAPEFCGIIDKVTVGGIMFRVVRADLSRASEARPVLKGNHLIWDSKNGLAIAFCLSARYRYDIPSFLRAWPASNLPFAVPRGEGADAADAIHHIITKAVAARDTHVPADPGNVEAAPQHGTAVMPDLAVRSLPLGGTMILELGRCIEPAGRFRSAMVVRNYKDTGAAQAWCDGYARRHKQGGN